MEQEEWDLRDTAYASLREILGAPRDEWPTAQNVEMTSGPLPTPPALLLGDFSE